MFGGAENPNPLFRRGNRQPVSARFERLQRFADSGKECGGLQRAGRIILGIECDGFGDSVVMLTREETRKCLLQRFADEPVHFLFPISLKPQCAQRLELCPGDVPAGIRQCAVEIKDDVGEAHTRR